MGLFSVERQLRASSTRLRRAREELVQVTEQLSALRSDADDATTDALVQGPHAKQEATQASRHAQRLADAESRLRQQVADLGREQDALLDRLPAS